MRFATRVNRSEPLATAFPAAAAGDCYRVGRVKGRTYLIDPADRPFLSIGMNHADSAPLRSTGVWQREFGDDMQRWLRSVRDDLHGWGVNTAGWVQEYVLINE